MYACKHWIRHYGSWVSSKARVMVILCFCTGDGETLQKGETEHKIKLPSVVLIMLHFYLKHYRITRCCSLRWEWSSQLNYSLPYFHSIRRLLGHLGIDKSHSRHSLSFIGSHIRIWWRKGITDFPKPKSVSILGPEKFMLKWGIELLQLKLWFLKGWIQM